LQRLRIGAIVTLARPIKTRLQIPERAHRAEQFQAPIARVEVEILEELQQIALVRLS
jgi:hypothetical protein